jgi:hypothetical protein
VGLLIAISAAAVDLPPRAVVGEAVHDFGIVRRGTTVRHTFTLSNEGTSRLVIGRAETTDPALSARLPKNILPGGEGRIALELSTDQVRGGIAAGVVIHTNDPDLPRISYELSGTVEWPIDIKPLPVAFLSAFEGEDEKTVLTLVNNDPEPLRVTGLEPLSSRFRASLETLLEGHEYRLVIETNPETPPGRYEETLEVLTDNQASRPMTVPVHLLIKSGLHADPDRLDFGSVSISQLQKSPALPGLLTQSVFVTASNGKEFEIDVQEEMPHIRVDKTPEGQSRTFRLDVTLVPEHLQPGPFSGAVRLVPDEASLPEVVIPIDGSAR